MSESTGSSYFAHSSDLGPWQPLRVHLENTAGLARTFAAEFGGDDLGFAAGILHDLGKYSSAFQKRLKNEGPPVDHSTAGAQVVAESFSPPIARALAFCIAAHHAGLPNGRGEDASRSPLERRLNKEAGKDMPALDSAWQSEIDLPQEPGFLSSLCTKDKTRIGFQFAFLTRMLFSCLVDADFRDTEAYFSETEGRSVARGGFPALAELRERLEDHFEGLDGKGTVNTRRKEILAAVRDRAAAAPGNFSLTVPTGGGKTLTSLAFALDHAIRHGLRRIIYVIPFTSIVEQNAAVFREALGDEAVLEHHSQYVDSPSESPHARDKLFLAMENWDAPIVVTTGVQFFESLFAARPARCRKLHNISGSVVILDEAQTLPLEILRPCLAALDELTLNYNSSVVLCTATQPAVHERTEDPERSLRGGLSDVRELAPDPEKLYEAFRRVRVSHGGEMEDDDLAEACLEQEQVLCIVNNRRHARALYEAISYEDGVFQLTTLMCAKHRTPVLNKIRRRLKAGEPCRVIATSLVEAGVDVDFPRVLRAEAGLDSIAQAAGRCNREGKHDPDQSQVLVFSSPKWQPPAELAQFAQAGREILRHYHEDPLSPEAIESYFRLLYWQRENSDPNGLDKHALIERMHRARLDVPFEDIARDFRMIEDTQKPVIIPWDDDARRAVESLRFAEEVGRLARQLQPYIVNVPERAFQQLRESGAVQPIDPERLGEQFPLLVNESLYDKNVGLCWEEPDYISPEKSLW